MVDHVTPICSKTLTFEQRYAIYIVKKTDRQTNQEYIYFKYVTVLDEKQPFR